MQVKTKGTSSEAFELNGSRDIEVQLCFSGPHASSSISALQYQYDSRW